MNIGILYGVAGGHHHAVSKVDAHMTFPRRIIRSLEENKVSGLCFGFGNVLTFLPKAVGCGAPYIVAVLVVHPADVAAAIEPSFRGGAAPHIGRAHILLSFLVDGRKFLVDYAVKKDRSSSPPKYLIFFKGRDADALTAAFTEYTGKKVRKAEKSERPSVLAKLSQFKELVKHVVVDRNKRKELER